MSTINLSETFELWGNYPCRIRDFGLPVEIGQYSIDGDGNYYNDDRQKKYLVRPSGTTSVKMDLTVNQDNTNRASDYYSPDRLIPLLKWIADNKQFLKLNSFSGANQSSVDFVALADCFSTFLLISYVGLKMPIYATKFQDVIYCCCIDDADREPVSKELRDIYSWGFKFEQYMTADTINGEPDITSCDHETEEFCIVVKNRFRSHSLLYRVEIDSIDPERLKTSQSGYTDKYVELKMCLSSIFADKERFIRSRLRPWWAQSCVAGIPEILCGFRNENGVVHTLRTFKTSELPTIARGIWSKERCISFCNAFLNFLKEIVRDDNPRVVYRFYQDKPNSMIPKQPIRCQKLISPETQYQIIPDWYIREMMR